MFHRDFFPTPVNVAVKMLDGINYHSLSILDPSAGKGDLLDVVRHGIATRFGAHNNRFNNLYAIEINPDLQAILRGKGYKLLDSDFMTYEPEQNFGLILMNPPFSVGARHFLKAYEISQGAGIVCLLNAETLRNDYSKERKLVWNVLDKHGVQPEFLGSVFADAERQTQVEIAMIKIPAQARERIFDFKANTFGETHYTIADMDNKQLASTDLFDSLSARYNKVKSIYHQVFTLLSEAQFYADGLCENPIHFLTQSLDGRALDQAYEHFVSAVRASSWKSVFTQTKLSGLVTSKVRDDLMALQEQQGNMAFTTENLDNLLASLWASLGTIRSQCILNAFDLLTKYHKDNCVHVEGWKTNDAWQIRPKVIIPYGLDTWAKSKISWRLRDEFKDIEKALCFVTNKSYESIQTIEQVAEAAIPIEYGTWYTSEFFQFKMFKKGTIHLKFNSPELCERFNIEAAQGKNWLPADYGKATV